MSAYIDADAAQAEWEEYIRSPCRPCAGIITARETTCNAIDAEFEVIE